jgi:predicted nucleotidyltransferase component of viral defense system
MISETRIRALARQDGVTAGLAEKHYVNSWVLYAVFTSSLGESLVFKGGTALSKLYFPEIWRFSEDLDFTATEQLPDVEEALESALADVEAESGISFEISNVHAAGDPVEYVQADVQYDAVLGQKNTADLDITFNGPLVFPIVHSEHAFEDVPAFSLAAYSIEEIFVEKLRSLFQRARARDYYDIYRLLEQESFDDGAIVTALRHTVGYNFVKIFGTTGCRNSSRDYSRQYQQPSQQWLPSAVSASPWRFSSIRWGTDYSKAPQSRASLFSRDSGSSSSMRALSTELPRGWLTVGTVRVISPQTPVARQ